MANDPWLDEIADKAMRELFSCYEVALVERQDEALLALVHSSAVSFSSDALTATVILAMGEKAFAACAPVGIKVADDWIGELANQLLGRAVNLLCKHGVSGRMGTPIFLPAALLAADGERWQPLRFEVAASPVVAAFVWAVAKDFVPSETPDSVMAEGDAVMF